MQRLDRLGWAASLSVSAYGVRLGVRTNEPDVLPRIMALLPPGSLRSDRPIVDRLLSLTVGGYDPRRNVRRYHLLYADALRLARTQDLEETLAILREHVQLYVAETAPRGIFVHAGVVGWRGRAILLPGASHAGKSTLVAALVRRGAVYYSDEYAVLDARGRVHPYARLPQLRGQDGIGREVSLASLGAVAGQRPLRVGLVALTRYQAAARWRAQRLSPGRATLEMLAHAVPARVRPAPALAALCRVASSAPVLKVVRGEAEEAARWLLHAVERGEAA
jgi:hypothetical protein